MSRDCRHPGFGATPLRKESLTRDLTAGGIMHAVTSAAQMQGDGDAAWDLEITA
jgi:hypothetical protein